MLGRADAPVLPGGRAATLAATAVALALFIAVVVCGLLIVRVAIRLVSRRWQNQLWAGLVARHHELDGELEKVWLGR